MPCKTIPKGRDRNDTCVTCEAARVPPPDDLPGSAVSGGAQGEDLPSRLTSCVVTEIRVLRRDAAWNT